jgi:hypothetical protein
MAGEEGRVHLMEAWGNESAPAEEKTEPENISEAAE